MLFVALAYLRSMPDAPAGAGYWTAGYGLWVLRLACNLAGPYLDPRFVTFLVEGLQATSTLFILAGCLCFLRRELPVLLLAHAIGLVIAWSAFTAFIVDDFLLRAIPLYAVSGAALIAAGVALLRERREVGVSATPLVGVALVLWGLHKLDYPWVRPIEWLAPFGFLLSEFLTMLAAVGLLLITAGRLRNIADRAERRHEQSLEYLATLNQLLQISLDSRPLDAQLADALDAIIAASWLVVEPRGGIFLAEEGRLKLRVERNLGPARDTVSAWLDEGQIIRFDGLEPQGHYVVPVVSSGSVLGVLLLYLPDERRGDSSELTHLRAVADALAGMIVRKRAEAEVAESRGRLEEAQRLARLGSWENDLRSGASIWSDEQYRILGYHPGEVQAHTDKFLARVHPADADKVLQALSAVEPGGCFAVDHRVVHPDGTVLYVSQMAEVFHDSGGRPVRMVGTCQDVTEDKAAEQALMEAKHSAEAANRAKSSFLATMSHELRTPLNAVIGFAQLLEQQHSGPAGGAKYKEYVGYIRESGEHLLAMINDILDLSRVESGQTALTESEIDLTALVRRTAGLMEAKAKDSGLNLSLRLPVGLPLLRGDERAIKQILLNLVANAIKFTTPGGEVAVEIAEVGDGLELSVSDTGIGIPPADQERVFEPFVQVESELNRRFEGTGLGLPLVRSLAEQHGGKVDLRSAPGEGTRVAVRFPAGRILPPHPSRSSSRRTG